MTPEPAVPNRTQGNRPPGINVIAPSESMASPCQSLNSHEKNAPFWTPGWGEGFRQLGWRWVFFMPALLAIAGSIASFFLPRQFLANIWWLGPKAFIWALMLPVTQLKHVMHAKLQERKDRFCIHCGYGLTSLPDNYNCPECGRHYTWAMIDEYRRDPESFVRRWRESDVPKPDEPFAAGPTSGPRRSRDGT